MTDQAQRNRIVTDLDTNLLVEAGAGSGKTTALVGRLLAHVRRGTPVDALAAVTFTRKAANELRERFQIGLEKSAGDGTIPQEQRLRLEEALRDLDRAFLGTIHAFCGRLLRERPLDAGLDPGFVELDEEAWPELVDDFWSRWVAECRERRDPALATLASLGIAADTLREAFHEVVDNPDVDFSSEPAPVPDSRACRTGLERLMARADELMPVEEPEGGWDNLQRTLRRLWYRRRTSDWSEPRAFFDAISDLTSSGSSLTQNRWGATREAKQAAKELHAAFRTWLEGPCRATLTAWREHRYAPLVDILNRAAAEFAARRARTGQLGFADLLVRAAHMLRTCPDAREELGSRFRYLLVDEFQDTDPIQAEVCFLLASPAKEGDDWHRVRPRPGSLFVVGDPKQSIYRFRRADIGTYNQVKQHLAHCGDVVRLTRNFRSTAAIAELVNRHFQNVFPAVESAHQAEFSVLETDREPPRGVGVHRLRTPGGNRDQVVTVNAAQVATWIAGEIGATRRVPGDFLVLTWWTRDIEPLARALAERNVPAVTTGAPLPQEHELRELLLVLRALADPANPIRVAAALEGLFFGLTPADLYAARAAGARFLITHPPEAGHAATEALAQLHEWWRFAGRDRPDAFLDRLLDDTGLLAWSASQALGEARAGALLQLVEAVRRATGDGIADLPGMVTLLEGLLEREAPDAPLRPGRRDVVRIMNLHKAKGLEATVVVLAAPAPPREIAPDRCVVRGADGAAKGSFLIRANNSILAQTPGWEQAAQAEIAFLQAEQERLHYVAATRAGCQLVISDCPDQQRRSCWAELAEAAAAAEALSVPDQEAPGRAVLADRAADLHAAEQAANEGAAAAAVPTWTRTTVTRLVREAQAEAMSYDLAPSGLGDEARATGTVMHRVLEAAGRGRSGDALRAFARAVAMGEGFGTEGVERLLSRLDGLLDLPTIKDVLEHEGALFEHSMMKVREVGGSQMVTEGVLDAAYLSAGGWQVVDWKLGSAGKEERPDHQQQVKEYAAMLAALSGRPAAGTVRAVPLE